MQILKAGRPLAPEMVASWEDVDRTLLALRALNERKETLRASFERQRRLIDESQGLAMAELIAEEDAAVTRVQEFAAVRRADVGKSRKLVHGKVGYRTSNPTVELRDPEAVVISRIRERDLGELVVTKEQLNKPLLKRLDPDLAASLGFAVVQVERFFIELPDGARLGDDE